MSLIKNSNLVHSICGISVVPLDEVDSLYVSASPHHAGVTLKSGKQWSDIYFTPGTAEFTEKTKDTDQGNLFEQAIRFVYPGMDETNQHSMDTIREKPLLVRFMVSSNAKWMIIGDIDNGAKLALSTQISTKASGHSFEFICSAIRPARWYSE